MRWSNGRADGAQATAQVERTGEPWRPPVLADAPDEVLAALSYVVVDDVDDVEGSVVVVLSEWPQLDDLGRVRHRVETSVEVDLPVQDLVALTKPAKGRPRRGPRVGDAFAMMLGERGAAGLREPVGPAVDVTADAREAARAAFYGAVSTPIAEHELPGVEMQGLRRPKAVALPGPWEAHVRGGEARR